MSRLLKVNILFVLTLILPQIAAAESIDIWALKDLLSQSSGSLACNASAGNFQITVDSSQNVILNAFVFDSYLENQRCETTLDEALCSYGLEKWVAVDLRNIRSTEDSFIIPGSVKASAFSTALENIECRLPKN